MSDIENVKTNGSIYSKRDQFNKNLSIAKDNSKYNRTWFHDLQKRVAAGEPYAYVNADTPTEIFKAMDIPVVVNQWWSSVVSAKQKSSEYLGKLNIRGYRKGLCQYCSLGFASTLETDHRKAPWGGLPIPTVVVSSTRCGSEQKVFGLWVKEYGTPYFKIEPAIITQPDYENWVVRGRYEWEDIFGKRTIDTLYEQYLELITFLEKYTGKSFSEAKLEKIMNISNEQEEYYAKARDLIAANSPAPLNIADQIPAIMIPQWHRGSEWARDRAKLFYEEIERMVESGQGAVKNERLRLMWLGTGLWYNLAFFDYFQEKYGAVFVWSIYLAIAADGYPTYGNDSLRTLAGRITKIFGIMGTPPLNTEWIRNEIKRHRIDGVVSLHAGTTAAEGSICQQGIGYTYFLHRTLEECGVPIFFIGANTVDARTWNDEIVKEKVSEFIEQEILTGRR